MKKLITDYKVVERSSLTEFNIQSQSLISEGYQQKGKLHVFSGDINNTKYVQLFVKKDK